LAHFTVKEYLISERIQCSTASQYRFDGELANTFIAETCLVYLLQAHKHNLGDRFPLTFYAAEFWMVHAENGTFARLQSIIVDLLQPKSTGFLMWIELHNPDDWFGSRCSIGTPIYSVATVVTDVFQLN